MRPRRLLITMLGDYWRGRKDPIPSGALVALLAEFDVSAQSSRSTLSRLTTARLLRRVRSGRRTFYQLTERTQRTFDDGAARIFGFGQREPEWDGLWSMVAFSVAERHRPLRYVLRTQLRWLGYAPLYDGLWISPHSRIEATREVLRELGLERTTLFRAKVVEGQDVTNLLHAWDLDRLRARYEEFVGRFRSVAEKTASGSVGPGEALEMRTRIMDAWRSFPREDPDLPAEFLPAGWPRAEARRLFTTVYEGLAPIAEARFRQLVEAHREPGDP